MEGKHDDQSWRLLLVKVVQVAIHFHQPMVVDLHNLQKQVEKILPGSCRGQPHLPPESELEEMGGPHGSSSSCRLLDRIGVGQSSVL